MTRISGRVIVILTVIGLVISLTGVGPAGAESQSARTITDRNYNLSGLARCLKGAGPVGTMTNATYVYLRASNGEQGFASVSNGRYSYTFHRMPTYPGSMSVTATWNSRSCSGCPEQRLVFSLRRKLTANNGTVDLVRTNPTRCPS